MRSRFKLLGASALAAAALAVSAAFASFQTVSAAPEPPAVFAPIKSTGTTFARICRSLGIGDSRPDPAWVNAAFLNDNCRAPAMPRAPDGFRATREQIVAGMAEAERYAAAADNFQKCIGDYIAARTQSGAPLSPAQRILENHRILVSEKNKKIASVRMEDAIHAFNEYGSDCPG